MATTTFIKGTEIRLSAVFTIAGQVVDPSTVTFRVLDPKKVLTAYTDTVVKDSEGTYHQDIFLDQSGAWTYRVEGTGAATVAGEGQLTVKPSQF